MRGPICLCVAMSQNEANGFADAAINAPSCVRAMRLGPWLLLVNGPFRESRPDGHVNAVDMSVFG